MDMRIVPEAIPDEAYNAGSMILCGAVRSFFSHAENRAAYDAWMRTPEGRRADEPGGSRGIPADAPEVRRTDADARANGGEP